MRVVFAGDVMLGRLVNQRLRRAGPGYAWGDTLSVLRGAELRVVNLECVISDRGRPWSATPKVFHFRTDSKNIDVLRVAGVDAVSLANNHSLDYEYDAMFDTLVSLDRAGIARAGAGRNMAEAMEPAFLDAGGRTAAFIAFTDNEPAWEAREHKPGVHFVPVDVDDARAVRLFGAVAACRGRADFVIVSAHWGPNRGYEPAPGHQDFGRRLIDSGASVVFGHSCHVFQGVEFYRGGAIIYGAGDFIDDYAVDEAEPSDESFIFVVSIDGRVESMELFPVVIERFHARMAQAPRARRIAEKMIELSAGFGTRCRWDEASGVLRLSPRRT